jgi:hypothetical protein
MLHRLKHTVQIKRLRVMAKATIKVQFPEGNTKPGNIEMLKFAFELGLDKQMTSIS